MLRDFVLLGMVRPQAGKYLLGRTAGSGIVERRVHRPMEFRLAGGEGRSLIFQELQARQNDLARVLKPAARKLLLHEALKVVPEVDVRHGFGLSSKCLWFPAALGRRKLELNR